MLQDHDDDEEDLEDLEDLEAIEEAWTVPDVTLPDLHSRENDVGSNTGTALQQEEVLPIPSIQEADTANTKAPTARDEVTTNASEHPTQVSLLFLLQPPRLSVGLQ